MFKDLLSPEALRKLLRYEPETGKLFWRERGADLFKGSGRGAEPSAASWNARYAGREALNSPTSYGHIKGRIFGVMYYAHRVIWAMETGAWPKDQLDHINGDPADNRIENLREVDNAENLKNQRISSANTSGVTGVHFRKREGKWRAVISVNRKSHYIGVFNCITAAMLARKLAEVKYGFHPNHGRKKNTVAAHGRREGAILCSSQAPSHPYKFPPNGSGQNAADRIANAMWEMGQ